VLGETWGRAFNSAIKLWFRVQHAAEIQVCTLRLLHRQFDIVEAHALFHLPWLTSGGVDVKLGQYVTWKARKSSTPLTMRFTRTPTFSTSAFRSSTQAY
jgi:hypothetical protein